MVVSHNIRINELETEGLLQKNEIEELKQEKNLLEASISQMKQSDKELATVKKALEDQIKMNAELRSQHEAV